MNSTGSRAPMLMMVVVVMMMTSPKIKVKGVTKVILIDLQRVYLHKQIFRVRGRRAAVLIPVLDLLDCLASWYVDIDLRVLTEGGRDGPYCVRGSMYMVKYLEGGKEEEEEGRVGQEQLG